MSVKVLAFPSLPWHSRPYLHIWVCGALIRLPTPSPRVTERERGSGSNMTQGDSCQTSRQSMWLVTSSHKLTDPSEISISYIPFLISEYFYKPMNWRRYWLLSYKIRSCCEGSGQVAFNCQKLIPSYRILAAWFWLRNVAEPFMKVADWFDKFVQFWWSYQPLLSLLEFCSLTAHDEQSVVLGWLSLTHSVLFNFTERRHGPIAGCWKYHSETDNGHITNYKTLLVTRW